MKGVVFTGNRTLELMQFDDPTPGPGEVVLEIKASGMCGSDLNMYRAPKQAPNSALGLAATAGPVIAGHEPCGVIQAVGSGLDKRNLRVGGRVMVFHYKGCGWCPQCRTGWAQMCDNGPTVYGINGNGGHAPYMKVPAETLLPLPDDLSFATGAAIACGTGTAFGALERLGLTSRDCIAIFGQGPVGLSATQLAVAMGARVIALDINAARLARAKEFGAETVIDPTNADPVAIIKEATRGLGADLALDTSGAPASRAAAVKCVRKWGAVCFVGEGGTVTIDVSPDMIRKQLKIMGSWTFSSVGQANCARFVAERGIEVDRLFTDRWRLDQAVEAYQAFDRQSGGKGVFVM